MRVNKTRAKAVLIMVQRADYILHRCGQYVLVMTKMGMTSRSQAKSRPFASYILQDLLT